MTETEKYLIGAIKKAAKEHAAKIKCRKCGRTDWRIVLLNELPSPIPSEILIFCNHCKNNESLVAIDPKFRKRLQDMCDKIILALKQRSGEDDIRQAKIIIPK